MFNPFYVGFIQIALAQRRQQADIQIQAGPVGQRVGNGWLGSLRSKVCWQRHHWNLHVNRPRIGATGQQRQQAQADERSHHSQQPL